MDLRNYIAPSKLIWTGRIDDTIDRDAFRMHQVVHLLDLKDVQFETGPEKLKIALIGFKSDAGVRRNLGRGGTDLGPEYIRKQFANLPVNFDKSFVLYDAGDICCVDDNLEEAQLVLQNAVSFLLSKGIFPIVLGGGHALALGHYRGIRKYLNGSAKSDESIGIVNFDAHWDLRPYLDQGTSGTMFSQIADDCSRDNTKYAYLCAGIQRSGNTRSLFNRAANFGADYILAKDFSEKNYMLISQKIKEFTNQNDHIYITLCSDVFNSAFAPGVSAMQPFGLNPEVVLHFIKEIFAGKKVIGFDIAEVAPRFDQDNQTAKLAAVIIYAVINSLTENEETIIDSIY